MAKTVYKKTKVIARNAAVSGKPGTKRMSKTKVTGESLGQTGVGKKASVIAAKKLKDAKKLATAQKRPKNKRA